MIRSIQKALSPLYYILFPQQSWLIKKYNRTWMDKDRIIFETLFGCVVHWVEVEGKSDRETSYDEDLKAGHVSKEYVKNKQKIESKITDIYLWHTHDRKVMEKEIDTLVNALDFGTSTTVSAKLSKKIFDLRSKIAKKDKEYMKEIVDICDHMWT
jgi:hypothetical protein